MSTAWFFVYETLFAMASESIARRLHPRGRMPQVEKLVVAGRSTGIDRQIYVTLMRVDGRWYVGHANGMHGQWVRNLVAAGRARVVDRYGEETPVLAVRLEAGHERSRAITEQGRQNPRLLRLVYRAGRSHLEAVGEYFRLDPVNVGLPAVEPVSARERMPVDAADLYAAARYGADEMTPAPEGAASAGPELAAASSRPEGG